MVVSNGALVPFRMLLWPFRGSVAWSSTGSAINDPFNVMNGLVVCSISTIVKRSESKDSVFATYWHGLAPHELYNICTATARAVIIFVHILCVNDLITNRVQAKTWQIWQL
jgi:hypothetical protein